MISHKQEFYKQIQRVDPYRFARESLQLVGTIPLANLSRLAPLLEAATGEVAVTLSFSQDAGGRYLINLQAQAKLTLRCERCLSPNALLISSEVLLTPVNSESEEADLPEAYEAVPVEEGEANLLEAVEDELLLSIPIVVMHEDINECLQYGYRNSALAPEEQAVKIEEPANPFKLLKDAVPKD